MSKQLLIGSAYSLLLFAAYMLAGGIIEAGLVLVFGTPTNWITDLLRGACVAFFAAAAAMEILLVVAKNRPVRGAVIAFIVWFAVNYAVHYLFFTWQTDFEIARWSLQSVVACITVWIMLKSRKPKNPPQNSN